MQIKCPECGYNVSDTENTCPNCNCMLNQTTSATVAPPKATAKGTIIALSICLVAIAMYNLAFNDDTKFDSSSKSSPSSSYKSFQESSDPMDMLVKRCATEAGIPSNDPKHKITPDEMRQLTDCINRNR